MAQPNNFTSFEPFLQQPTDRLLASLDGRLQYGQYREALPIRAGIVERPSTSVVYILFLKANQLNGKFVLERTVLINIDFRFEFVSASELDPTLLYQLKDPNNTCTLKLTLTEENKTNDNTLLLDLGDLSLNAEKFAYLHLLFNTTTEVFVSALVASIELQSQNRRARLNNRNDDNDNIDIHDGHFNDSHFNEIPKRHETNSKFYPNNHLQPNSIDNASLFIEDEFTKRRNEIQVRSVMMKEEREDEYVKYTNLRVFIGTWNVNGQLLRSSDEMRKHFLACDPNPPDIYAIGFQELDLSKEAYLFNDPSGKEAHWVQLCTDSLHPSGRYYKLRCIRLIGMMLIVFVKYEHCDKIMDVAAATVGTGLLGKMGNKGGVAVRFTFLDTTVCFVNCHLAAHQEQAERRNADFREINSRMVFYTENREWTILDHEQIYWFGDLNYRINDLTADEIKVALDGKQFEKIQSKDQLRMMRASRRCFPEYFEGQITHLPTYKYNPGTDEWDSSEKERAPAWCDRVLWRVNADSARKKADFVKQLVYRSHPGLKTSDHKPVSALFETKFKRVDGEKEQKIMDEIMKKFDKEENDYLPQVEIDKTDIDFGEITFRDTPLAMLTLKNTGKNPIRYTFASKPGENTFCRKWLQVTPSNGRIGLGQSTDITFELNFDVNSAIVSRLNYGIEPLQDTLVLRLIGGRDIFISVTAVYKPTSFGCSLDTLVELPRPICELTPEDMKCRFGVEVAPLLGVSRPSSSRGRTDQRLMGPNQVQKPLGLLIDLDETPTKPTYDIPKELFLMIDFIAKHGLYQQDLFQLTGREESDFIKIRSACDSGKPQLLQAVAPSSVMEAIILFLVFLPKPVIPFQFHARAIRDCDNFSQCKQIINEMPRNHIKTFEYIVLFLRELLKFRKINRLTPHYLAQKFGPVLLRAPERSSTGVEQASDAQLLDSSLMDSLLPEHKFLYIFLV